MEARVIKNFGVIGTILFIIGFIFYFYLDTIIEFEMMDEPSFIYYGVYVFYLILSIIIFTIGLILIGKSIKSIGEKMNNNHISSDYIMFVVMFILATSLHLIVPYFPINDLSSEGFYFVMIMMNIIMWVFLFISASSLNGCFELLSIGSKISIFRNAGFLWVLGSGLYAILGIIQLMLSLFAFGFIYLQIFALLIFTIAIIMQLYGFISLPKDFEIYTKNYTKTRQYVNIISKNDE